MSKPHPVCRLLQFHKDQVHGGHGAVTDSPVSVQKRIANIHMMRLEQLNMGGY